MKHPIDSVVWKDASTLRGNHWNPNAVMMPELRLLERSILRSGWIYPILITPSLLIADGFHRWRLSLDSREIRARDGGMVPCSILDLTDAEAMVMTVRMNRAKGSHVAVRMSSLVKSLVEEHGYDPDQVAIEIGAERSEVDLLLQEGIFKAKNLGQYRYSRAWIPVENGERK